jgi:hypothetical protein
MVESMMRKRTLIIGMMLLFVGINIAPIISGNPPDQLDQQQTEASIEATCYKPDKIAQAFKPTLDMLTRVELRVTKIGAPPSMVIAIRSNLYGDDLTSITVQPENLPPGWSWANFDFPDIEVTPEETYYIVWHPGDFTVANRLCWWATSYDRYPRGEAWLYNGDEYQWVDTCSPRDYTFKTYGYCTDDQPPVISSIIATPNPQAISMNLDITCEVTDNSNVEEVWITITYPDNTVESYPMEYSGNYYYSQSYTKIGLYDYFIFAVDKCGNQAFSEDKNFTVVNCGDSNADGLVDIGDAIYLINYMFKDGPPPQPHMCVGDVNNDGITNIGDALYLINYMFKDGPAPGSCCGL